MGRNLAREVQAILIRHQHVGDHGVERGVGGVRGGDRLESHGDRLGFDRPQPPRGALRAENPAIRRVIIDDENALAGDAADFAGTPIARRVLRRTAGLQRKAEDRTFSGFALDLDRPPHEPDQAFADRQPESGTAVLARGRCVDLAESVEQAVDFLRRDADTGVANGELDRDIATAFVAGVFAGVVAWAGAGGGAGSRTRHPAVHVDLALIGELHRVADQIDQHLAQTRHVAVNSTRHVRLDVVDQLDTLLAGALADQVERILDHAGDVERFVLKLHATRFDLGKIQDVVDQGQQLHSRKLDRLDVVALLHVERRVLQQAGGADHAVERSSNLVAHGGEKGRLRLRSLENAQVGLAQRELGLLALGDVGDRAGEAHRPSAAVESRLGARVDPDEAAIPAAQAILEVEGRAVAQGRRARRAHHPAVLGMVAPGIAGEGVHVVIGAEAEQLAIAGRVVHHAIDQVVVPYAGLHRFDDQCELFALALDFVLRHAALRDVDDRTGETHRQAGPVEARQSTPVDPQVGAVGAAQAILAIEIRLRAAEVRFARGLDPVTIVRVHQFAARPGQCAIVSGGVAEHLEVARREIGLALGPFDVPHTGLRRLIDQRKLFALIVGMQRQLLDLGEVGQRADDAGDTAIRTPHRGLADHDIVNAAIERGDGGLAPHHLAGMRHEIAVLRGVALGEIGGTHLETGLAQPVRARAPGELLPGQIELHVAPVRILAEHRIRIELDQILRQFHLIRQGARGVFGDLVGLVPGARERAQ